MEEVAAQSKSNVEAFERSSKALSEQIDRMSASAEQRMDSCFAQQADLIATQNRNVESASRSMVEAVGKQMEEVAAQSKIQMEAFERSSTALSEQIDRMGTSSEQRMERCFEQQAQRMAAQSEGFKSATKELEDVISQKTDELGARTDTTVVAQVEKLTAANQAEIRIALEAMEKTNREFAAKCDEASRSFIAIQENLNARYEQVLTKLEAANVSETVRLSKSIIKSINVKFGILLTGVAASIILAVLAYIK